MYQLYNIVQENVSSMQSDRSRVSSHCLVVVTVQYSIHHTTRVRSSPPAQFDETIQAALIKSLLPLTLHPLHRYTGTRFSSPIQHNQMTRAYE